MLRRGVEGGEVGYEVAAIKKQTGVDDTPKVVRDSVVSYCFNNDADFLYFHIGVCGMKILRWLIKEAWEIVCKFLM